MEDETRLLLGTSDTFSTLGDLESTLDPQIITLHSQTLSKTKSLTQKYIILTLFHLFSYSSCDYITVLFARTLYGYHHDAIVCILYFGYLTCAFSAVIGATIGNSYGFDKMAVIYIFLMFVGITIEAFSGELVPWAIGYLISRQAISPLCLAFIARMLPLDDSKFYTAEFYKYYCIFYLLGPVLSGLISYFINYRLIYVVNSVCLIIAFSWSYKVVWDKQKLLEKEQLRLYETYWQYPINDRHQHQSNSLSLNTNHNNPKQTSAAPTSPTASDEQKTHLLWVISNSHRFPTCLMKQREQYGEGITNRRTNNNRILINRGNRIHVSNYQWFITILTVLQFVFFSANEALAAAWFTVYMEDKYNCIILISTLQLAVYVAVIPITLMWASKILNKGGIWRHILLITANVVWIVLAAIIMPFGLLEFGTSYSPSVGKYIIPYFIFSGVQGICYAILLNGTEAMQLEVQPTHLAGQINGFKTFAQQIQASVTVLVVGLLWKYVADYNVFLYANAINGGMSFMLYLSVVICRNIKENGNWME